MSAAVLVESPQRAYVASAGFQPYGFLLNGGHRSTRRATITPPTTPDAAAASPPPSSCDRTPPQGPAVAPAADPLLLLQPAAHAFVDASEHGRHLRDRLEFVVPPTITPVERETPLNARALFIGHMRFETTTAEVRWLIKRLCGVTALKAEVRGPGCFVVYLANEADEVAVRGLNRRVLFDHNGVWFAQTHEALSYLLEYVERVLPTLSGGSRRRALRLPRDSIVVEDTRSKPNHHHHQQQQQQQSSPHHQHHAAAAAAPRQYQYHQGGGGAATPTSCMSPLALSHHSSGYAGSPFHSHAAAAAAPSHMPSPMQRSAQPSRTGGAPYASYHQQQHMHPLAAATHQTVTPLQSNSNSEPSTPGHAKDSPSSGFHGAFPPEYVLGDAAAPPPYNAASSLPRYHQGPW